MLHLGARLHAFVYGLFRQRDEAIVRELHARVAQMFAAHDLDRTDGKEALALAIAEDVLSRFEEPAEAAQEELAALALAMFDYEDMFVLPQINWSERRSVADWWELKDQLIAQKALLENFAATREHTADVLLACIASTAAALPAEIERPSRRGITVETSKLDMLPDVGGVVESIIAAFFDEAIERADLFKRHRKRLEANLIIASGGNPSDPKHFSRAPKLPSKSDIHNRQELIETYLRGTPLRQLFKGAIDFTIPQSARFEHHHIVAGTGHGKTQTLQYLIVNDLAAVERGEASVVVLDSQGDLINTISNLELFAPGGPLHDRICIIDPTDVEYPVSLNLFDVGLERLDKYSQLDRERLTNSILELYDFVLGSLLSAEMTQKQNVIFRYVTRLMLHIPGATIHTLRELMEPGSHIRFAEHIATLTGTARQFFETEFTSKEFDQTRKQVLRRLWGILENQTFERMFSHPRSKLDLYSEMNSGKIILINTAKDLLKESGTEIFGRFFIALIAQAAQERAVLPEHTRMPTFVYVDEAADYFDRNVGLILSQARKFKIGMVLAHQYLGQLDPKLLEAFASNTSVKFAGGVSNKDARALAPMMACDAGLIEAQSKGSFAAYVRGITKSALPLRFPFGRMEAMPRMTQDERSALQSAMRAKYAVHYSELDGAVRRDSASVPDRIKPDDRDRLDRKGSTNKQPVDTDAPDIAASPEW
ncbi:ATP-binding protein [Mesorhizobium sp.]|uniref:type IV secretory system conjugative DNA transfer family protein n=1 Tax=Mesorhizobium sp. TaxID=1871066 RepID=UPI000FE587E1|nr:ATP-binding protein [Mesorhizobium sp.]RWQ58830.1 MAG: ATP-binding protein [Mesorhizobium sp.]